MATFLNEMNRTSKNAVFSSFVDDTVIVEKDATQSKTIEKLQVAINRIHKWTRDSKTA